MCALKSNEMEGEENMKTKNSIYDSNLSTTEIAVYLFLKDHSDRNGECFHGVKTIARAINKSDRTVQRSLKALKNAGFIQVTRRYRPNRSLTSNLYKVF